MNQKQKLLSLVLFLFLTISFQGFSQITFSGEISGRSLASSQQKLPFWMYHNSHGRILENTNYVGWGSGEVVYLINEKSFLRFGTGVLGIKGENNSLLLDEAFLQYNLNWLQITAGKKHKEEFYHGLSATNENIWWSTNTKALPGIQIKMTRPLMIFPEKGIGFLASYEEYVLEKDRHVPRARVHHKNFHLTYRPNEKWYVKAGIQHFAQWGGVSKTSGPQPTEIIDYLLMITGREGRENAVKGDQVNVLGNQMGSYELNVIRTFKDWEVEFIYNSIFEDGTGSRFANFPDGRYGFMLDFKNEMNLVNRFLYEFYYTKNQSKNSSAPDKNDNYFIHNTTYNSDWTYKENILGVPFILFDPRTDTVLNNTLMLHHIGITGKFLNNPYKLLLSGGKNYGTEENYFNPSEDVAYINYELLLLQNLVNLTIELGAEFNSQHTPIYGIGLEVTRSF